MSLIRAHSAIQTLRIATALFCLATLTGCQSLTSTSSSARVRIVDLSPDAGPLDIYQGSAGLAHNLSYGSVTSYIRLPSAGSLLTVSPAGSHQVLSTAKVAAGSAAPYTLLILHPAASLQVELIADQATSPSSDAAFVRVIDQAVRSGPLDVYLVAPGAQSPSFGPVAANLAAGSSTGYIAVPAGTGSVAVVPTGTRASSNTFSTHTASQIDYAPGSARTILLVDGQLQDPSEPTVVAIPMLDAEPANR